MRKLFIHLPLFRLLSPLFSGVLVYLLILLIHNNVEHLQDQFFGEELYICIGLSFLIQELSRGLLLIFKNLHLRVPFIYAVIIQLISSLLLCAIVVTVSIKSYYYYVLGYSINSEELWIFNSIFCTVTFIYILLSLSHHYLYKVNTKKLNDELLRKQLVEEDFIQFKNEINPDLLFDSLEAVLVLMKKHKDQVDDLIDNIAATYRYVLAKNKRQLVLVDEEVEATEHMLKVLEYLPTRTLRLKPQIPNKFLMVPGSILKVVEAISRTSIIEDTPLDVALEEVEDALNLCYLHNDKLNHSLSSETINDLERIYAVYSDQDITVEDKQSYRCIRIPKLKLKS